MFASTLNCAVLASGSSTNDFKPEGSIQAARVSKLQELSVSSMPEQTKSINVLPSEDDSAITNPMPSILAEDLKYVPEHAYAIALIRPAQMAALEGIYGLPFADLAGPFPFKPSEIERALVTIYPDGSDWQFKFAFVIQLNRAVPAVPREKIAALFSPEARPFPNDDRIYIPKELRPGQAVVGFPDDRTILVSTDHNFIFHRVRIQDLLNAPQHTIAKMLVNLAPEAHAYATADLERLRHFSAAAGPKAHLALLDMLLPFHFLHSLQVAINLEKPDGLVVSGQSRDSSPAPELGKLMHLALASIVSDAMASFHDSLDDSATGQILSVENRLVNFLEATTVRANWETATIQSQELDAVAMLKLVGEIGQLKLAVAKNKVEELSFAVQLNQIANAYHFHLDEFHRFPRDIVSKEGQPLLSWRVAILPWLGENELYNRFRMNEPWNSADNLKLLEMMPEVYRVRGRPESSKTSIQLVTGLGTSYEAESFANLKKPRKSLAIIESDEPTEWTRPGGFEYDPQAPANRLRTGGSFGVLNGGELLYLRPDADHTLLRSVFLNDGIDVDVEQWRYHSNGRPATGSPVLQSVEQIDETIRGLTGDSIVGLIERLNGLAATQPLPSRSQMVLDRSVSLLKSESPFVRQAALKVIEAWSIGAKADWKALAEILQDPFEGNRWKAIKLLAEFREPELVRAMLRRPVQDFVVARPVLFDRYATIAADAAVPMLKESDPFVRRLAISLISSTGDEGHVEHLKFLLADNDAKCRDAAQAAIEWLQQPGQLASVLDKKGNDRLAALQQIAKNVQVDQDGNLIELDLSFGDTPIRLVSRDFRSLATLTHLQGLDLTSSQVTAKDIARCKDLPLQRLEINYCPRVSDDVAEAVRAMQSLIVLKIEHTHVGDETAVAIGQLANLQTLNISWTRVSDLGVEHLAKLGQLQELNLSGTRVTDHGVAFLAQHSRLQHLNLEHTELSDACIEDLATLKTLKFLRLWETKLTASGFERLRAALPNCRVVGMD